ncbi:DUF1501 domain-containing protein [soil metagenome]
MQNLSVQSRRQWLTSTGCGFGALALSGLATAQAAKDNPLAPKVPHHKPRAKRIIYLFMQGGVSHVDSYDYKPELIKRDGQQLGFEDGRMVANSGERKPSNQRVMKPHWKFAQHGQTGRWASDLFPEMHKHVDDLTFLHSLQTEGVAHGPTTLFLHCGSTSFVRPSFGSWVLYGLGSENQNLPGFVSIAPSVGNGGARNYGNAFLPAIYQGTALGRAAGTAKESQIKNLTGPLAEADAKSRYDLLRDLHAEQLKRTPGDSELEAVAASYELAWRMQTNAPDVLDLSKETAETKSLYGIGDKTTDTFGQQCLMARRLCESGVRFVQVNYGDNSANPAWDQHSNLPKHGEHAKAVDKPIAGLIADLKRRGLLEDTIVWWGGEFGRTPYAEKNGTGRDHNPKGFTVWMAGGGFKPGLAYGTTDEFGHHAVTDKVHMHDLHATFLHLLGLDHEKLTYRFAGRNFRLTDVHGQVVKGMLA